MKYHINSSGKIGVCKVEEGNCRFGNSFEHYNTFEKAQKVLDSKMKDIIEWDKETTDEINNSLKENGHCNIYLEDHIDYQKRIDEISNNIWIPKDIFVKMMKINNTGIILSEDSFEKGITEMDDDIFEEIFSKNKDSFLNDKVLYDEMFQDIHEEHDINTYVRGQYGNRDIEVASDEMEQLVEDFYEEEFSERFIDGLNDKKEKYVEVFAGFLKYDYKNKYEFEINGKKYYYIYLGENKNLYS